MITGIHAPKREVFDVPGRTNTDPKGFVRPVDVFRQTEAGLYMARPADHTKFHYIESWLLPRLNIRVTDYHFTPGKELDQDFYIDIMTFSRSADANVWRTLDLYLDVTCKSGDYTQVHDADEIALAAAAGVVTPNDAELALQTTFNTCIALATHQHDLNAWLQSEGYDLGWSRF